MSSTSIQPMTDARLGCSHELLMTRQAVFDIGKQTVGYDIKACDVVEDSLMTQDASMVCRRTLHQLMQQGIAEDLASQARLFVSITPEVLMDEGYGVLPPDRTCLKLSPEVARLPQLYDAGQRARRAGYTLAIEGAADWHTASDLLSLAQILQVDCQRLTAENWAGLVARQAQGGPMLLAGKVDTQDDLRLATDCGVKYVQGHFFCQPQSVTQRTLTTPQAIQLQFLAELAKPQLHFDVMESIIKHDVALMNHLLRYLNSAAMGVRLRVTSVKQALTMLGERKLRQWGSLVAIAALGTDSPHELLLVSLVRARFCEMLMFKRGQEHQSLDAFMLGLFSTLDVMLQMPMSDAIASLPLSAEVEASLLGHRSHEMGKVFDLACATERGAWASVNELGASLGLPQHEIASLYFQTIRWADDLYRSPSA